MGGVPLRLCFARGVAAGWPDLLAILPNGRSIFLELKAPGKKASELQAYRAKVLRDLGHDILATSDFNEARAFITRAMGTAAVHGKGGEVAGGASRRRPTAPPRRP